MKIKSDSDNIKRAKALPPPSWGVVSVPLDLLPYYFQLWDIVPFAWKYQVDEHDHVLYVKKNDSAIEENI